MEVDFPFNARHTELICTRKGCDGTVLINAAKQKAKNSRKLHQTAARPNNYSASAL
jgi:hypothetical protein